jgi:hypothetical protein
MPKNRKIFSSKSTRRLHSQNGRTSIQQSAQWRISLRGRVASPTFSAQWLNNLNQHSTPCKTKLPTRQQIRLSKTKHRPAHQLLLKIVKNRNKLLNQLVINLPVRINNLEMQHNLQKQTMLRKRLTPLRNCSSSHSVRHRKNRRSQQINRKNTLLISTLSLLSSLSSLLNHRTFAPK